MMSPRHLPARCIAPPCRGATAMLLAAFLLAGAADARADETTPPAAVPSPRPDAVALVAALDAAIASWDDAAIAAALEPVIDAASHDASRIALHLAAARGLLARADLLRIERHVGSVDAATNTDYRARQAAWGEQGVAHATAALELSRTDAERSEAHRLAGECTTHRISGPLTGIRLGPVARTHIDAAIALDPANPEAIRARGLMYLYNPPSNGGDLGAAVETFRTVAEMKDGDVPHALAAQAWLKRKRPERARLEVVRALALNPHNRLALLVQQRIEPAGGDKGATP